VAEISACSRMRTWSLFISIIFLFPVLHVIRYAKARLGVSEDFCTVAVALYFIVAFVSTAGGWAARYDIMYKDFLRSARRNRLAFAMLPFGYLGGAALIVGVFYLINFKELVDDFLLHGNFASITKFFAVIPFSLMLISVFLLHVLALARGSLR
jgi:hypothetical protein